MTKNNKLQIGHERKLSQFASRGYPTHLWVKLGSHTLGVINDGSGWPRRKDLLN